MLSLVYTSPSPDDRPEVESAAEDVQALSDKFCCPVTTWVGSVEVTARPGRAPQQAIDEWHRGKLIADDRA